MKQAVVSVVMITYNHEKYIQQAIEGVLMQQVNFPVELIIADDASPDQTESIVNKIIAEHTNGHWIKYTKHITNKGMNHNFLWACQQAKGKYIALCEGDDYWTDPYKLQKQLDFMEANPSFGLVATHTSDYYQAKKIFSKTRKAKRKFFSYNFEDFLLKNRIQTVSVLLRNSVVKKFLLFVKNNPDLMVIDYSMWLYVASISKIGKLKDVTAVYRIRNESISQSTNRIKLWNFQKEILSIIKFYVKIYEMSLSKKIIDKAYYNRAKIYYINATYAKDIETVNFFSILFKGHHDYMRLFLMKLILFRIECYKLALFYERIVSKIKRII